MRIARVIWDDAHTFEDQVPLKDLGHEPCRLYEVGYLLKETKTHVVLGLERQPYMEEARFTLTIPRVNIREMHVIDERAFTRSAVKR